MIVDQKAVYEIRTADVKTGVPAGRRTVPPDCQLLTIHDGIAYVLNPLAPEAGVPGLRGEIAAFALAAPEKTIRTTMVPRQVNRYPDLRVSGKGFVIGGDEHTATSWVAPVKK